MRHVFAKAFLDDGGTLKDLGNVLGHNCVATTMRYVGFARRTDPERMARVEDAVGISVDSLLRETSMEEPPA